MNKLIVSLVIVVSSFVSSSVMPCNAKNAVVSSPDGAVTVTIGVESAKPFYTVSYQGKVLVSPSHLGFRLDDGEMGTHVK